MQKRFFIFAYLSLLCAGAQAGDFQFWWTDTGLNPGVIRSVGLYPQVVSSTGPNSFLTLDPIIRFTDLNGGVVFSNIQAGTYMAVYVGTQRMTTNWYSFPQISGYQYASNYVSNAYIYPGSRVPAYSTTQSDARFWKLSVLGPGNNITFTTNGDPITGTVLINSTGGGGGAAITTGTNAVATTNSGVVTVNGVTDTNAVLMALRSASSVLISSNSSGAVYANAGQLSASNGITAGGSIKSGNWGQNGLVGTDGGGNGVPITVGSNLTLSAGVITAQPSSTNVVVIDSSLGDTVATLTNKFNALASNTRCVIRGTFSNIPLVEPTVVGTGVPGMMHLNNVTNIVIKGEAAVLSFTGTGHGMTVSNVSGIWIDGLWLQSNISSNFSGASTPGAILFGGTNYDLHVINCTFNGWKDQCLTIQQGATAFSTTHFYCQGNSFYNIGQTNFPTLHNDGSCLSSFWGSDVWITDNYASNCLRFVEFEPDGQVNGGTYRNIHINRNTLTDHQGWWIAWAGDCTATYLDVEIIGNHFSQITNVQAVYDNSAIVLDTGMSNVVIADNVFRNYKYNAVNNVGLISIFPSSGQVVDAVKITGNLFLNDWNLADTHIPTAILIGRSGGSGNYVDTVDIVNNTFDGGGPVVTIESGASTTRVLNNIFKRQWAAANGVLLSFFNSDSGYYSLSGRATNTVVKGNYCSTPLNTTGAYFIANKNENAAPANIWIEDNVVPSTVTYMLESGGNTTANIHVMQKLSGSPAGSISASPGSMWYRTDGAGGSTLYVKQSGSGTSGWAAVAATGDSYSGTQFSSTSGGNATLGGSAGFVGLFSGTSPSFSTYALITDGTDSDLQAPGASGTIKFMNNANGRQLGTWSTGGLVLSTGTFTGDAFGLTNFAFGTVKTPGTYYVSPTGLSSNSGLTAKDPWNQTNALAGGKTLDGATFIFMNGTYTALDITNTGVKIVAATKWGASISNAPTYGIAIEGTNVTIDGFHIALAGHHGIEMYRSNCIVQNCWIHDSGQTHTSGVGSGTYIASPNGWETIQYNLLENNGFTDGTAQYHGVYIQGGGNIARGNVCRYNWGAGISDGNTGVTNYYSQNLTYKNHFYAVAGSGFDAASKSLMWGNTFVETNYVFYTTTATSYYVTNCILFGTVGFNAGSVAITGDHNLTNASLTAGFVTPANGLYWLTSGSAARNIASTAIAGPFDFWSNAQTSVLDVGAFQYDVTLADDTRTQDPSPSNGADYWVKPSSMLVDVAAASVTATGRFVGNGSGLTNLLTPYVTSGNGTSVSSNYSAGITSFQVANTQSGISSNGGSGINLLLSNVTFAGTMTVTGAGPTVIYGDSNKTNALVVSPLGVQFTNLAGGVLISGGTVFPTNGVTVMGGTITGNGSGVTNQVTSRLVPGLGVSFATNNPGASTETMTLRVAGAMVGGSLNGAALNTTARFVAFNGGSASSAPDSKMTQVVPMTCTATNFYIRTFNLQAGTNVVYTVMTNGVACLLTANITGAGGTTIQASDTTHSAVILAGTTLSLQYVGNNVTSDGTQVQTWSMELY